MTTLYTLGNNLYVNLTNRCPCRCDFCIRKNGSSVGDGEDLWLAREPTVEEVKAAFAERDLSQYDQIVFCGYGEPLERLEDVVEICRYLRGITDRKLRVNTNGLADLIHGRPTARLLSGCFDTVSVSLNTCNAEKYVAVCHPKFGEASYQALLDFARDCKQYVPEVILSVVDVIPQEDIDQCKEIAKQIGVPLRVRHYEG